MSHAERYSPTSLGIASAHCPRALDYYQENREKPKFYQVQFQVGIAAHEFLQRLGDARSMTERPLDAVEQDAILSDVTGRLMKTGRDGVSIDPDSINGVPLDPDSIIGGRELAVEWWRENDLAAGVKCEYGVAYTRDWMRCGWDDSDARFRMVYDVIGEGIHEDESMEFPYLFARDYKTAWTADASTLETLQMKAQLVGLYDHAKLLGKTSEGDALRMEIGNLRTGRLHFAYRFCGPETDAFIAQTRSDLTAMMKALDDMRSEIGGARTARPGCGCIGCPWAIACNAGAMALASRGIPTDPIERARLWGVVEGIREALHPLVKADAAENGYIMLDGDALGMVKQERRHVTAEGAMTLLAAWESAGGDARGFLTAAKEFPVSAAENVVKKLVTGRDERERMLESVTEAKVIGIFKFRRNAE